MSPREERYYSRLAAAFVRGRLGAQYGIAHSLLFEKPLEDLEENELEQLFELGKENGLKLHKFKRSMELPRVKKVLGILRGLQPENLLDIGTGRGVFLWNLLHNFPHLMVHCLDILDFRVSDLQAVHQGGIAQLNASLCDIRENTFEDNAFDMVSALEVIEHIPDSEKVIAELCRVARRYIVISVPSKEDENPEHIHLLDQKRMQELFKPHAVSSLKFDYVLNHMIVLAKL